MCGILGISSKNSLISEHQFRESLELLHHRGPDNTCTHYHNNNYDENNDTKIDSPNLKGRDKIKLNQGQNDIINLSPTKLQHQFLCQVNDHLNDRGRLYLAIENKFNYQYFLWKRDPHVNLFYTSFLPKFISNLISYIFRGRPYRNYIYSKNGLKKLLKNAGFTSITSYAAFPSYQTPLKIIPIEHKYLFYEPVYIMGPRKGIFMRVFRIFRRLFDELIFNKLKLLFFVPAFIIIAEKETMK